ncbi:MAG: chloride channel protein [bacterium]
MSTPGSWAWLLSPACSPGSGRWASAGSSIVQIGSAVGSALGTFARLPGRYVRILVASGAAGGISATFNTPIAGAIFAAEVILGDFGVSHFTPVVVASVLGTAVGRSFFGTQPTFAIPEGVFHIVSVWEFLPYALLGLLAALVALVFIRALNTATRLFHHLEYLPAWARPAAGGALLGLVAVGFPQVLGVGYDAIETVLSPEPASPLLLLFLVMLAKVAATSFTLGSGGSGGLLSPSLFIGVMLGSVVGSLVQGAPFATAQSGAYAMVGMGSVLAAATHAPLTAVLMLFELTGNYQIILAMMLSCTLATADVQAVRPEDDLSWVMHEFERTGADEIPVVDPQEGKLLGTLRKNDVIARYNREMLQRDMAREVHEGPRHTGLPVTVPSGR